MAALPAQMAGLLTTQGGLEESLEDITATQTAIQMQQATFQEFLQRQADFMGFVRRQLGDDQ